MHTHTHTNTLKETSSKCPMTHSIFDWIQRYHTWIDHKLSKNMMFFFLLSTKINEERNYMCKENSAQVKEKKFAFESPQEKKFVFMSEAEEKYPHFYG